MKWIVTRGDIAKEITIRDLTAAEKAALNPDNSYQTDRLKTMFQQAGISAIDVHVLTNEAFPFTAYQSCAPCIPAVLDVQPEINLLIIPSPNMATLQIIEQAIAGSGNYTLQGKGANLGSTFTDLAALTGKATDGLFDLIALTVDTSTYIAGNTYTFRVKDTTTGFVGTELVYTIPEPHVYVISDYVAAQGTIGFVNTAPGLDSYEANFVIAPAFQGGPGVTIVSLDAQVVFWLNGVNTTIENSNHSADLNLPLGANGAGVYSLNAKYHFSNGLRLSIARVIQVDASGNILADFQLNGFSITAVTGLSLTLEAHVVQTNAAVPFDFGVSLADGGFALLGSSNPGSYTLPPSTQAVLLSADLSSSSEFADYTGDFFPNFFISIT